MIYDEPPKTRDIGELDPVMEVVRRVGNFLRNSGWVVPWLLASTALAVTLTISLVARNQTTLGCILVWPLVWLLTAAPFRNGTLSVIVAWALAITSAVTFVFIAFVGPWAILLQRDYLILLILIGLNSALAMETLNLRIFAWAMTVTTVVILVLGVLLSSLCVAGGGWGVWLGWVCWIGISLTLLVTATAALLAVGRWKEAIGYFVAWPLASELWFFAAALMPLLLLLVPLAVTLIVGYVYLAWHWAISTLLKRPRPVKPTNESRAG